MKIIQLVLQKFLLVVEKIIELLNRCICNPVIQLFFLQQAGIFVIQVELFSYRPHLSVEFF